jgi:L-ascorbate metabolism protein UlaG (beta-lactamase superfamily)
MHSLFVFTWFLAAELEITPTYNAGVRLACGAEHVYLDTFFSGLNGYQRPPEAELAKVRGARPPYDRPLLIFVTHAHGDHFDPDVLAALLEHDPQAALVGTSETAGVLRDRFPRQVTVLPRGGQWRRPGLELHLIDLAHSGDRWAKLENSAHWIRFCGQTLFHPGDADLVMERFVKAFQGRPPLDVALVPFWYLAYPDGRAVTDGVLKPKRVFALHGDLRDLRWVNAVRAAYPKAVIPSSFLVEPSGK